MSNLEIVVTSKSTTTDFKFLHLRLVCFTETLWEIEFLMKAAHVLGAVKHPTAEVFSKKDMMKVEDIIHFVFQKRK